MAENRDQQVRGGTMREHLQRLLKLNDEVLKDLAGKVERAHDAYVIMRKHLRGLFPKLNDEAFRDVLGEVEEWGHREVARRVRETPAKYGFKDALAEPELRAIDIGLNALAEASDRLDLEVAKVPAVDGEQKLMAFGGELGLVQAESLRVIMLDAQRQERGRDERQQDDWEREA